LIIRNTLKFNKLTSSNEIYENLIAFQNIQIEESDSENAIDIDTIENICDTLCVNKGVLIKLKKNNECFYKLNITENE
jgi:hypothetical protein